MSKPLPDTATNGQAIGERSASRARDCLDLALESETELSKKAPGEATALLDRDYDRVLAAIGEALACSEFSAAAELTSALDRFWLHTGRLSDRYARLKDCMAAGQGAEPELYLELMCRLGRMAFEAGDYSVMLDAVYHAEELPRERIPPRFVVRLKGIQLAALDAFGRFDEAAEVARRLAEWSDGIRDPETRLAALINASAPLGNANLVQEALGLLERAMALDNAHGTGDNRDMLERNRVHLLILAERYGEAREALRTERERRSADERTTAPSEYDASITLAEGYLEIRDGNPEIGREACARVLDSAGVGGVPLLYRFLGLLGLAEGDLRLGRVDEALCHLLPVLDEAVAKGHWRHLARSLELAARALSGLAAAEAAKWRDEAARLAQALRDLTGLKRSPWEERQWESLSATIGRGVPAAHPHEGLLGISSSSRALRRAMAALAESTRS